MSREGFYIIRCPRCGRYTYAPTRQKTRLCVYCQRIFKINPLSAVFVEDANTARTRVKLYQTGKHHKEFIEAMEKSRDKIHNLIPDKKINLEHLQDSKQRIKTASTRHQELERILHEHAQTSPLDLQVLEQECLKAGIPWDWATQQIETLIRTGHLILPKPWQVRLVMDENTSIDKQLRKASPTKLARIIGTILRDAQISLSHKELIKRLEDIVGPSAGIEEALNLLRSQGYIIKTSKGTYQWTGD